MTIEQIIPLLEKYWACEASLEEERALKTFFSGDSIPEELKKYRPLFLWKTEQLQQKGNREPKIPLRNAVSFQWYSFLKIAASVLVVITLGVGVFTRYQQEKQMDRIFSETFSDPEDALQETKNVIGKVSSALNLAKGKQVESTETDSLMQSTHIQGVE